MVWHRTDDGFPEHPKSDALAEYFGDDWAHLNLAFALWHHMGCDCAARRTDGVFNAARACRVMRAPRAAIDKALGGLVAVRLVETRGDGFAFHDWAEYQPTRAQLDADREAKTARQSKWRKGKADSTANLSNVDARVDASTPPSVDASRDGTVDAAPSRPVPSRPVPKRDPDSDAGAQAGEPPRVSLPSVEPVSSNPEAAAEVLAALSMSAGSAQELELRAVLGSLKRPLVGARLARLVGHVAEHTRIDPSGQRWRPTLTFLRGRDGTWTGLLSLLSEADGCHRCGAARPIPKPARPTPPDPVVTPEEHAQRVAAVRATREAIAAEADARKEASR